MSPIRDGVYQIRFVPAHSDTPSPLAATGEAVDRPVRVFPSIPPLLPKQTWVVRRVHDYAYTIEWTVRTGPATFFSIDGPIRPDVPVVLLHNIQEWVITEGNNENVYRIGLAGPLPIGVNWALDQTENEELQLRPFPIGEPTPQWLFVRIEED